MPVRDPAWVDGPPAASERLEVQISAHGRPVPATWSAGGVVVTSSSPSAGWRPGQSVVLYRGDAVVGGGTAVSAGLSDDSRHRLVGIVDTVTAGRASSRWPAGRP